MISIASPVQATAGRMAIILAQPPRTRRHSPRRSRRHALRLSPTISASAAATPPSRGHRQPALDRRRVAEEVEHRAVRIDRVGQLAVALGRLRPDRGDVELDAVEARAGVLVEAEEAVQVEVPLDGDLDAVERDAELG